MAGQRNPSVTTLPEELLTEVFSYIHGQKDRSSLCRSSKQIRRLVTPALYETVAIYLDRMDLHSPFFRLDNPGHQCIRTVIFDGCSSSGLQGTRIGILNTLIRQTLARVEKDTLQCFVSPVNLPLTLQVLRDLRDKQRRLHHLELGPMPSIQDFGHFAPRHWLNSLRSLTVPGILGSTRELDFYSRIIQRPKKLTTLSIDCTLYFNGFLTAQEIRAESHLETRKKMNEGDLKTRRIGRLDYMTHQALMEQLFRPPKGQKNPEFTLPIVYHLILPDVLLDAATLDSTLPFGTLQHLTVTSSERDIVPWSRLALLAQTSKLRLRGFRYYYSGGDREISHEMEDFLKNFAGLEILVLQGLPPNGFDMKALYSHLTTLQRLSLSGHDPLLQAHQTQVSRIWEADFTHIPHTTLRMANFKQLSLPFPKIGVGIDQAPITVNLASFMEAVHVLAKLPLLETLRMWTWPLPNKGWKFGHSRDAYTPPNLDDITSEPYIGNMAEFAQKFVRMLADAYRTNGSSLPVRTLKFGRLIGQPSIDRRVLQWRANFCYRVSAVHDQEGQICDYKTSRMTVSEVRDTTPVFDQLGCTLQDEDGLGLCELSPHTWREVEGWP